MSHTSAPSTDYGASSAPPRQSSTMMENHSGQTTPTSGPLTNSYPHHSLTDAHGRTLNPRSCITCRRRKVKCDKAHPCSNCVRNHVECIYPGPGRAPRRPRRPQEPKENGDLLLRLRRLEGVVKNLGVEVPSPGTPSNEETNRGVKDTSTGSSPRQESNITPAAARRSVDHASIARSNSQGSIHDPAKLENRFGRLVVSEGRSRYVNTSFWASLSNEVEDLKDILNEYSEEDDDEHYGAHNDSHGPGQHHGWIFNFSSQNVDMAALHPEPSKIKEYWSFFRERVDPLVKVLHIPSTEPTILDAASHLSNLSKGFEALLFSIYYGAVTSATPQECLATFGETRAVLLTRYRFAVEQSLARAHFLTAEELVILQAFIIFMLCLRRNNDARVIWTLTSLVVRIAQNMGLHRDGTQFGLSILEIEVRRRIWWQICLLDVRASEDHGCDPMIVEASFDTKVPLNINDSDISTETATFPREHEGCTDMSFALIRIEVVYVFRKLNSTSPSAQENGDDNTNRTFEEKERLIQEVHDRLENKYLKHCDMTVPLYWVTATVARLMMAKMWLIFYHPFQRHASDNVLSREVKDKLFLTSLENIEYAILLETETKTMKWGWLFRTYMQWHALAFLLQELCVRTRGPLVERAWLAISRLCIERRVEFSVEGRAGYLWKPLTKLLERAQAQRQKAIDEDSTAVMSSIEASDLAGQVLPGSVAEYLQKNRDGSMASSPGAFATKVNEGLSGGTPLSNSMMLGGPAQVESPSSFLQFPEIDTMAAMPAGAQNFNPAGAAGNMNSTAAFGTNTNGALPDPSTLGFPMDESMSLDANGELDWVNFDNMVRQFGMDTSQSGQSTGMNGSGAVGNIGQAAGWNGWNGFSTTPGPGAVGMGDWF